MEPPSEGDVFTMERTFSTEEVRTFAKLSGDTQPRHVEEDEDGRLLLHGLLTASLPTAIGSDLEVLARTMELEFEAPVHTGETIECRWENETVAERDDRYDLTASVTVENEAGTAVLSGTIAGLVWKG